ncbi:hypothetical protein CIP107561_00765 [Corynebacterium diphtheriae]|nr:hypothetical protein CIP107561_00765 [Corynebacterium diphtheriae]
MSEKKQQPLLEMRDVRIAFTSTTGIVEAVRGIDLTIYPGQSVAIVGESGSGKSTTAMSIIGLLPGTGKVTDGQIILMAKTSPNTAKSRCRSCVAPILVWCRRTR